MPANRHNRAAPEQGWLQRCPSPRPSASVPPRAARPALAKASTHHPGLRHQSAGDVVRASGAADRDLRPHPESTRSFGVDVRGSRPPGIRRPTARCKGRGVAASRRTGPPLLVRGRRYDGARISAVAFLLADSACARGCRRHGRPRGDSPPSRGSRAGGTRRARRRLRRRGPERAIPEPSRQRGHEDGRPTRRGIRHQAEREANAALNIAFSLTFVLGPALGGAAVAGFGATAALLIDAGSFLICGSLLVDLSPHIDEAGSATVRSRLAATWHHITGVRWLGSLLLAQLVAMTFIETGAPIEVPFVKSTLGAGDGGLGLVLAMWGAGAVVGSLGFARLLTRPLAQLLAAGTLLIGVAYLGLALSHMLASACVAGLVGGIGNSMQWPGFISIVQQLAGRLHGRLMGAVESLGAIGLAAGLILGGVLVTVSSTRRPIGGASRLRRASPGPRRHTRAGNRQRPRG